MKLHNVINLLHNEKIIWRKKKEKKNNKNKELVNFIKVASSYYWFKIQRKFVLL